MRIRRLTHPMMYHAAKMHYGPFRVEMLVLGPVDRKRAAFHYERGLLRVRLPRPGGGERL